MTSSADMHAVSDTMDDSEFPSNANDASDLNSRGMSVPVETSVHVAGSSMCGGT